MWGICLKNVAEKRKFDFEDVNWGEKVMDVT
jgi:hypothetical protein